MVAEDAAVFLVKEELDTALGGGDAMGVFANEARVFYSVVAAILNALGFKKHKNECHSDISAVHCLVEIICSRVVVHVHIDLVYTGEGMDKWDLIIFPFYFKLLNQ